jgi:prepilin-type processing-associated H-X9-DG protein
MKGYGTFFVVYLNDSDGVFPDPEQWLYSKASDNTEHPIGCRWHDWPMAMDGTIMAEREDYLGVMRDYLKEISISPCPDFRDIARKMGCENRVHNPALPVKPQYNVSMNAYLGSDRLGGVKNEEQVYKPASKFILGEENAWSVRPDHPKYPARWLSAPLSTKALDDPALLITPTPQAENCFATFHGGKKPSYSDGHANLTFLDGHVMNIEVREQLRKKMHGTSSLRRSRYDSYSSYERKSYHPGGNLYYAWPLEEPPLGGWEEQ